MGSKSPQFCRQLQIQKEENQNEMAAAINKRKEAKQYYQNLSKSLENVQDTVKRMDEENDLHLAEMISLLESSGMDIPEDETAVSLAKKLQDSSLILKQELKDTPDLDDHLKNTTITVQLNHREIGYLPDIIIPPISEGTSISKYFLLASHLLLSSLNRSSNDETSSYYSSFNSQSGSHSSQSSYDSPIDSDVEEDEPQSLFDVFDLSTSGRIDFRASEFVMNFSQRGRVLGSIQLRPDSNFSRNFGHNLGRFGWTSPRDFEAKINKAHPGSFATMYFTNQDFRMNVHERPEAILESYSICIALPRICAIKAFDVGFSAMECEGDDTLTGFQLTFLVKDYDANRMGKMCPRFGQITAEGGGVLDLLSRKRLNDRDSFTVSIECRPAPYYRAY